MTCYTVTPINLVLKTALCIHLSIYKWRYSPVYTETTYFPIKRSCAFGTAINPLPSPYPLLHEHSKKCYLNSISLRQWAEQKVKFQAKPLGYMTKKIKAKPHNSKAKVLICHILSEKKIAKQEIYNEAWMFHFLKRMG